VIRDAIKAYPTAEEREAISRQIVEGYKRIPQSDEELDWTDP
jgi:hypothetical protein